MTQIIYILTNPAMPNLIKIGMTTTSLEQRIAELSRATWVPLPFEVFYAAEVQDANLCESLLHNIFIDKRINAKREFFSTSPEQAVSAIKLAEINNITPNNDIVDSPEEKIALDEAKKKRDKMSFKMIDIPEWSILKFTDDNSITCTTTWSSKVLFEWNEISLSASAVKAYQIIWKIINYPLQWPAFWMYENETLWDRRLRIENWY